MRLLCVLAGAHHADVAGPAGQSALDGRDVELRVVSEHADGVSRAEQRAAALQHPVRPVHDDLVSHREALLGGEDLPRVADRHVVAEHLGHPGERGGEVDGAEDHHPRWRGEALDEDVDGVLVGLALGAVVAHTRPAGLELGDRVTADDAVEVGVAEGADGLVTRADEQLGADARTVDHRREANRLLLA